MLAIVISRKGCDENCEEQIFCSYTRHNKKILVLNEEDIIKMLQRLDKKLNPIDIINDAYYKLLLKV